MVVTELIPMLTGWWDEEETTHAMRSATMPNMLMEGFEILYEEIRPRCCI